VIIAPTISHESRMQALCVNSSNTFQTQHSNIDLNIHFGCVLNCDADRNTKPIASIKKYLEVVISSPIGPPLMFTKYAENINNHPKS